MYFFQKLNYLGIPELVIDGKEIKIKKNPFVEYCEQAGIKVRKTDRVKNVEALVRFLIANSESNVFCKDAVQRLQILKRFVKMVNQAGFKLKEFKSLFKSYNITLSFTGKFVHLWVRDLEDFLVYRNNRNIDALSLGFILEMIEKLKKELHFFETKPFSFLTWDTLSYNAFYSVQYGREQLEPSELYEKEKEFYDTWDLNMLITEKIKELNQDFSFSYDYELANYYFRNGENTTILGSELYPALQSCKEIICNELGLKEQFEARMQKIKLHKWKHLK